MNKLSRHLLPFKARLIDFALATLDYGLRKNPDPVTFFNDIVKRHKGFIPIDHSPDHRVYKSFFVLKIYRSNNDEYSDIYNTLQVNNPEHYQVILAACRRMALSHLNIFLDGLPPERLALMCPEVNGERVADKEVLQALLENPFLKGSDIIPLFERIAHHQGITVNYAKTLGDVLDGLERAGDGDVERYQRLADAILVYAMHDKQAIDLMRQFAHSPTPLTLRAAAAARLLAHCRTDLQMLNACLDILKDLHLELTDRLHNLLKAPGASAETLDQVLYVLAVFNQVFSNFDDPALAAEARRVVASGYGVDEQRRLCEDLVALFHHPDAASSAAMAIVAEAMLSPITPVHYPTLLETLMRYSYLNQGLVALATLSGELKLRRVADSASAVAIDNRIEEIFTKMDARHRGNALNLIFTHFAEWPPDQCRAYITRLVERIDCLTDLRAAIRGVEYPSLHRILLERKQALIGMGVAQMHQARKNGNFLSPYYRALVNGRPDLAVHYLLHHSRIFREPKKGWLARGLHRMAVGALELVIDLAICYPIRLYNQFCRERADGLWVHENVKQAVASVGLSPHSSHAPARALFTTRRLPLPIGLPNRPVEVKGNEFTALQVTLQRQLANAQDTQATSVQQQQYLQISINP